MIKHYETFICDPIQLGNVLNAQSEFAVEIKLFSTMMVPSAPAAGLALPPGSVTMTPVFTVEMTFESEEDLQAFEESKKEVQKLQLSVNGKK